MTARWIVLDTSVFIAIIHEEPKAERFLDILEYDIRRHFSAQHVVVARQACTTYGKDSGHNVQLNFSDCTAYALAKILEAPLLFKGKNFGETDVMVA
jgi:ribonuclease VapC